MSSGVGCSSLIPCRLLASLGVTTDPLAWLVALEGVPSGYAAARDGIDVMLRDRGLRRTSPETTAESLLRGAHASRRARGLRRPRWRELREGAGDAIAADAVRMSASLLALAPAAQDRAPAGASPASTRRRPAALGPERAGPSARRGRRPTGCAVSPSCCWPTRPPRRCSSRRSCTPTWRRPRPSPPTTASSPAPSSGWCWSRAGSTRSRWSCPRPGTWRCARSTSPTCGAYRDGGPRGRARLGALRRRGVRRGRGGVPAAAGRGVAGRADMRTAPDREIRCRR